MGVNSYRKEFVPMGTNSFLYELTPAEKGGKNANDRVASHFRQETLPFSFLPPFFSRGVLLKEKNSRSYSGKAISARSNMKSHTSQKLSPSQNMVEHMAEYPLLTLIYTATYFFKS